MVEIRAIGGYGEVGRNCTAIKAGDEVVLIDLGLKMDAYVEHAQDEDYVQASPEELVAWGAVPDLSLLGDWKPMVKAILLSHAHLDHIGAVPYFADQLSAPLYGTPYTMTVLESVLKDKQIQLPNACKVKEAGSSFSITKNITVEFIHMTHSIPGTVSIRITTPEGSVLYANDFKLDRNPVLGKPFDQKRLAQCKPDLLIIDALYADKREKTPDEAVVRDSLLRLFTTTDFSGKAVFTTTFSSHIARLQTLVDCARKLRRKPVFLGRSLHKYVEAAKTIGLGKPFEQVKLVKYGANIRRFLDALQQPQDYFFVVTGHQGEPKATLAKLVDTFAFQSGDVVVFSCTVIPTDLTRQHRKELEAKLEEQQVQLIKDLHVSGHGAQEDLRQYIRIARPKQIIGSHAPAENVSDLRNLALHEGYPAEAVHTIKNGETLTALSRMSLLSCLMRQRSKELKVSISRSKL